MGSPPVAVSLDALRCELALVRAELAAVRQAVDALRPVPAVSLADVAAAKCLLPAIADACASASFVVGELVLLAREIPALRTALTAAVGSDAAARRLGRLLRRLRGVPVDGLIVDAVGASRDGTIWMLRGFRGTENSQYSHRA